jgi:hypothetical protein
MKISGISGIKPQPFRVLRCYLIPDVVVVLKKRSRTDFKRLYKSESAENEKAYSSPGKRA